jgi:hypothetical protein
MPTLDIIYIGGSNFSGTTLLAMMLGAHPNAHNLGEFVRLPAFADTSRPWIPTSENPDRSCTCGAPSLQECAFWCSVVTDAGVSWRSVAEAPTAPCDGLHPAAFAVLRAAQDASASAYLIDASKSPGQLRTYLADPRVRVQVVHVIKHIREFSHSYQRRSGNVTRGYASWVRRNVVARAVGRHADAYVPVSYRALATRPNDVASALLAALDMSDAPNLALEWRGESHGIGGNRMRRDPSPLTYRRRIGKTIADRMLYYGGLWAVEGVFMRQTAALMR